MILFDIEIAGSWKSIYKAHKMHFLSFHSWSRKKRHARQTKLSKNLPKNFH
jgi:hypothetical protein